MKQISTLLAALVLLSPLAANATVIGGGSDTGSTNFVANYMQGYDFTPTANASLTDLGFWDSASDGLASTYQVGLWNTTTQALLASVSISNADALDPSLVIAGGAYRYETLGTAISLIGGESYTLAAQIGNADMSEADSLIGTFTGGSNITLSSSRRFESGAAFVFPTGTTTSSPTGQVNARFGTANPVPEPTTLALLGLGLAGLGYRKRK